MEETTDGTPYGRGGNRRNEIQAGLGGLSDSLCLEITGFRPSGNEICPGRKAAGRIVPSIE
jgi:hypothetical protein